MEGRELMRLFLFVFLIFCCVGIFSAAGAGSSYRLICHNSYSLSFAVLNDKSNISEIVVTSSINWFLAEYGGKTSWADCCIYDWRCLNDSL